MPMYQVKSLTKRWSTMIELIGMMAIMALGISAMLGVIGSWEDFAKTTEDTIKAINLAREWIEWITNIRDTNWLRFSSDKANCWRALAYDSFCIGNSSFANNIWTWSYLLYSSNWAWLLSWTTVTLNTTDWSNWSTYTQTYKTWLDQNWYFTQTGWTSGTYCSSVWQTNCLTAFTREIQVSIPWSSTGIINVASIVRWIWKWHHEIQLNTTLSNWKSKF